MRERNEREREIEELIKREGSRERQWKTCERETREREGLIKKEGPRERQGTFERGRVELPKKGGTERKTEDLREKERRERDHEKDRKDLREKEWRERDFSREKDQRDREGLREKEK